MYYFFRVFHCNATFCRSFHFHHDTSKLLSEKTFSPAKTLSKVLAPQLTPLSQGSFRGLEIDLWARLWTCDHYFLKVTKKRAKVLCVKVTK